MLNHVNFFLVYYKLDIMISNLFMTPTETLKDDFSDGLMPFSDYITYCRSLIEETRSEVKQKRANYEQVIEANSPFEFSPSLTPSNKPLRYGALLIHGLLDCPFSLRDLGAHLKTQGILSRAVLLPGHGTVPNHLLSVSYKDWIKTVEYGVASLRKKVDRVFLVGYSTGAALSVYQAMQDPSIAGIILLAPAIKIKAPVDIVVGWHKLLKSFRNNQQWIYKEDEIDYAKYLSIPFNPVHQVTSLTKEVARLPKSSLNCPIFITMSREDETISSQTALDFFSSLPNKNSEVLLYSSTETRYLDKRIHVRTTSYPDLNIQHFSHIAIPFAPTNVHYGQYGDYAHASHVESKEYIFGAYNHIEENTCDVLHKLGLIKYRRRTLTYNPDFDFMAGKIAEFIKRI